MENFLENQRLDMEQVVEDEGLAIKEPFQKTQMWSKKQQKEIDGLVFSLKCNMMLIFLNNIFRN